MTNSMIEVLDEYRESTSGNPTMGDNQNHYHPTTLNGDEDEDNVLNIAHALLASVGNERHVQHVQQTWCSRILGHQEGWAPQIATMCNAFLEYKNSNPMSYPFHDSDDSEGKPSLLIMLVDIHDGEHRGCIPVLPADMFPAVSLMCTGYISPSPIMPTIAFSV
ncbi:hypothetical protein BS47DRAFT_568450 [Hydnum rufescens UP504]|uniref:Uncharacterized protein n=1 Tax=Hydnum rufescens UP504 TaxID=1448309 RepID=A0A9P6B426_9AGAM|nr:hypothetical protein BS47DRAFT_568450 [Hydnum rufescens UP504]